MIRNHLDHSYDQLPYQSLAWQSSTTMESIVTNGNSSNTDVSQPDEAVWPMTAIAYPGKHDVMLGRGGESNYHAGNLTFRSFIQEHKIRYQQARKQEKPIIALEVVLAWRDLSPPGRFLARIDPSRADSLWEDVGDEQACKRAGRTLGEKCSGQKVTARCDADATPNKASSSSPPAVVGEKDEHSTVRDVKNVTGDPVLNDKHAHIRQPRRPQGTIDFIASFTSGNAIFNRALHSHDDSSERVTKKRKLCLSPDSPDAASSSGSSTSSKKTSSIVSRKNSVKIVEECIAASLVDRSKIRGDRVDLTQRLHDLPTAEFLTRSVCWD